MDYVNDAIATIVSKKVDNSKREMKASIARFVSYVLGHFVAIYDMGISYQQFCNAKRPKLKRGDVMWLKGCLLEVASHIENFETQTLKCDDCEWSFMVDEISRVMSSDKNLEKWLKAQTAHEEREAKKRVLEILTQDV